MELSLPGKVWARHFGFGLTRPQDDHRTPLCHMTGTLLAAIAKFLSGASVRWIDCQPDTCQRVYFANHTSHLDPLSAAPGRNRFLKTVVPFLRRR